MLHLPLLRAGRPYRSLDVARLTDVRSGEPVVEVSQANPGLIARDLGRVAEGRRALARMTAAEIVERSKEAAGIFVEGEVRVGEGDDSMLQGPEEYVRHLSSTTGMPHALARANMGKIHFVLANLDTVLQGLSRGLDPAVLDRGWGEEDGRTVSYRCLTDTLGVVLPSNSPGVHSLWIPALGLKVPVTLKPGSREPWTPLRVTQALIQAGLPREAFGFYPSSHAGAGEILLRSGRSMLFGDRSTVGAWANDPRVQLHGPGWSKVILGADQASAWRDHVELLATSVAANGGRSCINASGVWIEASKPGLGREVAEALAERLAGIEALPLDHPDAGLAAFPDPSLAHRMSDLVDGHLAAGGAEDLTARYREGGRVVEVDGYTYLLPTVVWCDDPGHPLARMELLFPFVSIVELPADELLDRVGSTLVASAITQDPESIRRLVECPDLERLNLGAVPTSQVDWDQPHEGNLFLHLYQQRAMQAAIAV